MSTQQFHSVREYINISTPPNTSRRRANTVPATSHPQPPNFQPTILNVETHITHSLIDLDPDARPRVFRNAFEEYIFVFTVMMATAATTFIQGVIIINTATIGANLNMTKAQTEWISAAVGLASGSFMLFFGKTADIFGQKLQFLCGMALLSIFSLITSFSPNPILMNVCCGLLGFGTAIVSPPAIGSLFATYPEGRRRNKAAGALGAANPIGFVFGSISSGLTTKYWSWRASFYTISIFFLLMTILAYWTMPAAPGSSNVRLQMRRFDYLGTALAILGMGLFSAGLTQGPELGWKSPPVLIILFLGILCLLGFGIWENCITNPLLNPAVWRNKTFSLCVLSTMFGYMSFITNQFWICLYMQQVQKFSPSEIAVRLLPQAIVGVLWSYIGQALTHRLNGTTIMAIGGVAYLVGAILVLCTLVDGSYWNFLFPALLITVIGADFQFIISNLYINTRMPRQSALAAGVLQTATRLSISIGLAVTAAVYGSMKNTRQGQSDVNIPYSRAYLGSIVFAIFGLLFIPFMQIGVQGGKSRPPTSQQEIVSVEERPRSVEPNTDEPETEEVQTPSIPRPLTTKPSQSSMWTGATIDSDESYFPRWSWEEERWIGSRGDRYRGAEVVYEVCVKCLEERKVIVGASSEKSAECHVNENGGRIVSRGEVVDEEMNSQDWSGGQWNNDWNHKWYAQRGVKEGGQGWV